MEWYISLKLAINVFFFLSFVEPLSFLQRLAECLEYSTLLDQAALADSTVEKFHLLSAFVISTLSTHLERMSKPFNPLLGETYELERGGEAPFHYIAEQVSHHPPISALHARGQNWTLHSSVEPKVKFHGTNVIAISEGKVMKHFQISKIKVLFKFGSSSKNETFNFEKLILF